VESPDQRVCFRVTAHADDKVAFTGWGAALMGQSNTCACWRDPEEALSGLVASSRRRQRRLQRTLSPTQLFTQTTSEIQGHDDEINARQEARGDSDRVAQEKLTPQVGWRCRGRRRHPSAPEHLGATWRSEAR